MNLQFSLVLFRGGIVWRFRKWFRGRWTRRPDNGRRGWFQREFRLWTQNPHAGRAETSSSGTGSARWKGAPSGRHRAEDLRPRQRHERHRQRCKHPAGDVTFASPHYLSSANSCDVVRRLSHRMAVIPRFLNPISVYACNMCVSVCTLLVNT